MRSRSLTSISGHDLWPLLAEEIEHWAGELLWDYSDVASAVQSGLDRRVLAGRVLENPSRPVAYCYYMVDGTRAIVGSLFASETVRHQGIEETLLASVLDEAQSDTRHGRVECQSLFSTAGDAGFRFAQAGFAGRPRHYLVRSLARLPGVPGHGLKLRSLRRDELDVAARIIYRSHLGSLDAALNTTYSSPSSCRGFVDTLVHRSGCGRFDQEASLVAEEAGEVVGVVLASLLSRSNGHVCQVSVNPEAQGRGLGRVLVAAALVAFGRQGLTTASLSVTVGNERAYGLYQRMGFRLRREFEAYAWERSPGRIQLPS